jgi:CRP-like cAMP-binding protein
MAYSQQNYPQCKHCADRYSNVFCKAKCDSMEAIEQEKICTSYKKGEAIFKEGARPFGIYCLNSGKIKLVKTGDDGREHIVRLVRPGDPLGYRSLLSGDRYNASAVAIEDCHVCFIPKELFLSILSSDHNLSLEMMRLLSSDLAKAEEHMTHLAQKPVRERVAEALLFIKETYGFEEDNATINACFSREDIANIVGTATETVIRLLSELNKEDVIRLSGKKIIVLNMEKLIKIANIFD